MIKKLWFSNLLSFSKWVIDEPFSAEWKNGSMWDKWDNIAILC